MILDLTDWIKYGQPLSTILNKYQKVKEKDLLAICDVGAYGAVLASNYNLRTKPSEILINQSSSKIITKRQKLNNII